MQSFYQGYGATINDFGVLTNSGTLDRVGGLTGYFAGGDGAKLNVSGVLTNTGLIDMEKAYGGRYSADQVSGTSNTISVAGKLVNDGTIIENSCGSYYNDSKGSVIQIGTSGTPSGHHQRGRHQFRYRNEEDMRVRWASHQIFAGGCVGADGRWWGFR